MSLPQIILSTVRLNLRLWRPEDTAAFAEMNASPEVMSYFPRTQTPTESQALIDRTMQQYAEHGFCLYATELKENKQFIGCVGLAIPSFEAHFTPAVEIGWRLDLPFHGQGYATEAAQAVLAHAFMSLRLPEVVSFTVPENRPSRRVMEKIGLHHHPKDNFARHDLPLAYQNHVLYRLKRNEYLQLHEKP